MIKNTEKGFTLIELLIVVALMAISVGITSDILITLVRSYNKSQVINEIEQNATFVTQKLEKELRNATRITALKPGDPLAANASFSQISFENKLNETIIYKIEGNVIYRDAGDGSGFLALTSNASQGGVSANCTPNATSCFTLLSTDPQVVRISMYLTQAGSSSSTIFTGRIDIQDTIVIRDTY